MKNILTRSALVLAATLTAGAANANTTYGVFCADGEIEVDMRSLQEMVSARGNNTCQLGRYQLMGDADRFAQKNFGGVGASCSC
jgi:hypothetical protein